MADTTDLENHAGHSAWSRLLALAQAIVDNSTAPEAEAFDTAAWLDRWIQLPQPALGGRRPAELMDSVEGFRAVARTLGAIESGVFL
jgi:uncharacterized protein (DUF2384 family)